MTVITRVQYMIGMYGEPAKPSKITAVSSLLQIDTKLCRGESSVFRRFSSVSQAELPWDANATRLISRGPPTPSEAYPRTDN